MRRTTLMVMATKGFLVRRSGTGLSRKSILSFNRQIRAYEIKKTHVIITVILIIVRRPFGSRSIENICSSRFENTASEEASRGSTISSIGRVITSPRIMNGHGDGSFVLFSPLSSCFGLFLRKSCMGVGRYMSIEQIVDTIAAAYLEASQVESSYRLVKKRVKKSKKIIHLSNTAK